MSAITDPMRRRWIAAAGALVGGHALAQVMPTAEDVPGIRALDEYRAGRPLKFGRLKLVVPRIADNGNAVSMRVVSRILRGAGWSCSACCALMMRLSKTWCS